MRQASRQAESLGHALVAWQVDDPETATDNRITTCRRCERIAAVDIGDFDAEDGPFLVGAALRIRCEVPVVTSRQDLALAARLLEAEEQEPFSAGLARLGSEALSAPPLPLRLS
jgi:hypothetical protein